ncbi:hypothetical protein AQUCO_08900012v1 [Aquilegia coerulea]|uniref:Uncharacterized protein n=1 Tax=Aquilegia coerulea TaxID=218851 RepID=A0A2G5C663_AQUCA|nr:hypothetical protein AQUCO_08900012v1 [Aquilegia coerulea]
MAVFSLFFFAFQLATQLQYLPFFVCTNPLSLALLQQSQSFHTLAPLTCSPDCAEQGLFLWWETRKIVVFLSHRSIFHSPLSSISRISHAFYSQVSSPFSPSLVHFVPTFSHQQKRADFSLTHPLPPGLVFHHPKAHSMDRQSQSYECHYFLLYGFSGTERS